MRLFISTFIALCSTEIASAFTLTKSETHLPAPFSGTHSQHHWTTTLSTRSSSGYSTRTRIHSTNDESDKNNNRIDLNEDSRLYRIRLPRAPGIEWGTDLSFAFVYVRSMDPTGPAALSGQVQRNDQLCEMQAVQDDSPTTAVNLIGAPFDYVMENFASLEKTVSEVDLVFFRGTKEDLKKVCAGSSSEDPETITVTVIENKGSGDEKLHTLTAPAGTNVRQLCVDNGINVYQSVTRWTNCKGKQLCGTCIVNIPEGSIHTNRKSMDEASTLRENPDSYRLSCVTFAYGDCTVETFPPIKASQWTR